MSTLYLLVSVYWGCQVLSLSSIACSANIQLPQNLVHCHWVRIKIRQPSALWAISSGDNPGVKLFLNPKVCIREHSIHNQQWGCNAEHLAHAKFVPRGSLSRGVQIRSGNPCEDTKCKIRLWLGYAYCCLKHLLPK